MSFKYIQSNYGYAALSLAKRCFPEASSITLDDINYPRMVIFDFYKTASLSLWQKAKFAYFRLKIKSTEITYDHFRPDKRNDWEDVPNCDLMMVSVYL